MSMPNGRRLATSAHRLQALGFSWFDRTGTTRLFRYDFDAIDFARWYDASEQWVSHEAAKPVAGTAMGKLIAARPRPGRPMAGNDIASLSLPGGRSRWLVSACDSNQRPD